MGVRRCYFECCDSLRMSSMLGEDVVRGRDGRRMHGDQEAGRGGADEATRISDGRVCIESRLGVSLAKLPIV
jgi:hypothetical protein